MEGVTLPPWAMVVLGVGLPVLTLLGKSAMTFLKSNRHEDRQDHDQVFQQQAAMITSLQIRHDQLSRIVEDNSVKHGEEVYKLRHAASDAAAAAAAATAAVATTTAIASEASKAATESAAVARRHQEDLEEVKIKQELCEEQHKECQEQHKKLTKRVAELEAVVGK